MCGWGKGQYGATSLITTSYNIHNMAEKNCWAIVHTVQSMNILLVPSPIIYWFYLPDSTGSTSQTLLVLPPSLYTCSTSQTLLVLPPRLYLFHLPDSTCSTSQTLLVPPPRLYWFHLPDSTCFTSQTLLVLPPRLYWFHLPDSICSTSQPLYLFYLPDSTCSTSQPLYLFYLPASTSSNLTGSTSQTIGFGCRAWTLSMSLLVLLITWYGKSLYSSCSSHGMVKVSTRPAHHMVW